MREVRSFDTADGLYDCCWCEDNENILVSASGDGSVKVRSETRFCLRPCALFQHSTPRVRFPFPATGVGLVCAAAGEPAEEPGGAPPRGVFRLLERRAPGLLPLRLLG